MINQTLLYHNNPSNMLSTAYPLPTISTMTRQLVYYLHTMASKRRLVLLILLFVVCDAIPLRVPLGRHRGTPRTRNQNLQKQIKRTLSEQTGHTSLFGNLAETQTYYTTVYIGGQHFSVLIGNVYYWYFQRYITHQKPLDTGSVNLAVPMVNCHMYDNPTDSKAVGPCKTANSYYDPSINGTIQACTSGCALCQDHNCWFSIPPKMDCTPN